MIRGLIAGAIVAILCGLAMWGLDRVGFYLILVVPLVAGALIGAAVTFPTVRSEVSKFPLIIVAIICGAVALGIYWYASYMSYIDEGVTAIQEQIPTATREEALEFIDSILIEAYGSTGFQGFLADYASTGLSITRTLGSSTSLELKNELAYGYWVIEALLLIGMAVVSVLRREQSGLYKRMNPTPTTPAA